ncbi:MAG: TGS domain-containing protein, partial [Sphingobacteriaceae bacterium]|nr:TGS domain-containing protein [Sphingobacteriaceae bacterium]
MIKITLPDGSIREVEKGTTSQQVALSISEGLARNVLAAKVNGEVWDSNRPIEADAKLQLLTWNDDEGKSTFWHSSAHLMAEALEALYPGVKFWVGPPLENGFYYDVDLEGNILTPADFEKIESKMLDLARQNNAYVRKPISKSDAINYFKDKNDVYKLDLLERL